LARSIIPVVQTTLVADTANSANSVVQRDSSGNIAAAGATFTSVTCNGQEVAPISTVSTAYTVGVNDYTILCDATAAAFAVTLPAASTSTGRIIRFKKLNSNANNITLTPSDAATIDGAATKVISTQYAVVTIQSNGTNWYIIAN
jgi:hypothetical protein